MNDIAYKKLLFKFDQAAHVVFDLQKKLSAARDEHDALAGKLQSEIARRHTAGLPMPVLEPK